MDHTILIEQQEIFQEMTRSGKLEERLYYVGKRISGNHIVVELAYTETICFASHCLYKKKTPIVYFDPEDDLYEVQILRLLEVIMKRKTRDFSKKKSKIFFQSIDETSKGMYQLELASEARHKIAPDSYDVLTQRQKEVIELRYEEGYDNEEIAGILNISIEAVKNRIHKALHNIREYNK